LILRKNYALMQRCNQAGNYNLTLLAAPPGNDYEIVLIELYAIL